MNIQNPELKTAIKDAIQGSSIEGLPNQLMEKVTPVIDVNPNGINLRKNTVIKHVTTTATGTGTVYTTPTDKDFYLTGATLSLIKDATCDVAIGRFYLSITLPGSASADLLQIPILTLTAQNSVVSISILPTKLAPGVAITALMAAYTAGLCSRGATIIGYTVDRF